MHVHAFLPRPSDLDYAGFKKRFDSPYFKIGGQRSNRGYQIASLIVPTLDLSAEFRARTIVEATR